jgi:hypothetical protein
MTDPIQIDSPQANINRARFAGKDFFTFVDDIVARIQALFVTEFNDFVVSGTGLMLIDIVSWAAETLSFYIDRQATESYISTARTRKGVVRLARQLGYKVAGAVSAATNLQVTLDEIQAIDVPVPVGFQWLGPDNVIFETVEEVIFPSGEGPTSTPREVGVRQGVTRVEIFTSTGALNQVFKLSPGVGATIAADSLTARVDGTFWEENPIITFDQTDQFETGIGNDPPTIRFGNGVAGNVPELGVEIRVEYVATVGSAGLVQSDTINDVVAPLVVGTTVIPVTVTNPDPTSGGSDQESLDRVKANAPRLFRAHTVAITRDDYESIAQAYTDPLAGSVAVAQAFVARSADDDLQLQTLIANIQAITNELSANVKVETAAIEANISDDPGGLEALRVDAETTAATATTEAATVDTSVDGAKTSNQLAKNKSDQVGVDANDIKALVIDGKTEVDASAASAPEKTAINEFFDLIDAEADNIIVSGGGITSDTTSAIAQLDTASEANDEVTAGLATITADMAAMDPLLVDIQDRVVVIDGLMDTSFETAIATELQAIFDHVDGFLSADCKANLIQVPILTRDANGFLAAPPIALLRSLGDHLEERKEVSQDPEVVSGEPYLVGAVIDGTIGVLPGFVQATVLSNVRKAIDDILKVRAFGASLRKSDLDAAVAPNPTTGVGGIAGVKYAVFNILGPAEFLNAYGNLIIDKRCVITKGTVTLVAEAAAA